jgi:hypothetical protein
VYQHSADLDLDLTARGELAAFATLFYPHRDGGCRSVSPIAVKNIDGADAYPVALGIRIEGPDPEIIGSRPRVFGSGYDYGDLTTDAEAFVYRGGTETADLDFVNARAFALAMARPATRVEFNSMPLSTDCWQNVAGGLAVQFTRPLSGTLSVVTGDPNPATSP